MKMADLLGQENIPSVMLNPEPLLENSRVIAGISFCRAMQDNSDTLDSMVYANAKVGGTLMTATKEVLEAALADAQSDLESVHAIPDENGRKARLMELLEALDDEDEVYESFLETLKRKPMAKLFEYVNDFTRFGSAAAVRRTHSYPGVVLTTAHSSKGLEWPVVYNLLSKYETPEMNSRSPIADEIYEERKRLLFVSATRARDELIMTGQYLAYGNAKDGYRINTFLQKSMDIAESTQPDYDPNKSSFTYADVMQMKAERKAEAERLKKKAELAKKLDEAEALESKTETPQAV
jgi:superfamily I DNA/RNA helicase